MGPVDPIGYNDRIWARPLVSAPKVSLQSWPSLPSLDSYSAQLQGGLTSKAAPAPRRPRLQGGPSPKVALVFGLYPNLLRWPHLQTWPQLQAILASLDPSKLAFGVNLLYPASTPIQPILYLAPAFLRRPQLQGGLASKVAPTSRRPCLPGGPGSKAASSSDSAQLQDGLLSTRPSSKAASPSRLPQVQGDLSL